MARKFPPSRRAGVAMRYTTCDVWFSMWLRCSSSVMWLGCSGSEMTCIFWIFLEPFPFHEEFFLSPSSFYIRFLCLLMCLLFFFFRSTIWDPQSTIGIYCLHFFNRLCSGQSREWCLHHFKSAKMKFDTLVAMIRPCQIYQGCWSKPVDIDAFCYSIIWKIRYDKNAAATVCVVFSSHHDADTRSSGSHKV
jgi:hypothetical protein